MKPLVKSMILNSVGIIIISFAMIVHVVFTHRDNDSKKEVYRVTAYCPCKICCGQFADGLTATGDRAVGKIVAAPKEIPFGTWIYIPEYGWAEVKDRGGSIKGKRLDVLFGTHEKALEWGVKYLEVKI